MADTQQTFKLLGPDGNIIMKGALNSVMEQLPDTPAREAALDQMLKTAVDAVEAEEKQAEAVRSCAQMLSTFADAMNARLDQFEKQRAISAKRAKAARKEAAQRQVRRYLDELPDPDQPDLYSIDPAERQAAQRDEDPQGAIPPPADPTGASLKKGDDGDLEIKHAPDPERYGSDEYPGGAVRNAVGIRCGAFSGNMKVSFQAARSIG
jgi:hypothetical protein